MTSPYDGKPSIKWESITKELIGEHPLEMKELRDIVFGCWTSIFESKFGASGFRIGADIFPKPQIMGFLLHELIPLELANRYPKKWRGEESAGDKDIVYVPEDLYSIEVKTSSNPSQIFGNRSYAQASTAGKKSKSGYYLAINFESCTKANPTPGLTQVKFGWLDSSDWIGQKSATGQQARLPPDVQNFKLLRIDR